MFQTKFSVPSLLAENGSLRALNDQLRLTQASADKTETVRALLLVSLHSLSVQQLAVDKMLQFEKQFRDTTAAVCQTIGFSSSCCCVSELQANDEHRTIAPTPDSTVATRCTNSM